MVFEFKFPDVGEGIAEGTLIRWKVKEGDFVKADQPLADIETDKAIVEVPSPIAGKIAKLHSKEGEIINVGAVLVTYDKESEAKTGAAKPEIPKTEIPKSETSKPEILRPEILRPAPVESPKTKSSEKPGKRKDAGAVVGQLPEYEEVPERHYFFLKTGEQIRSLGQLKEKLESIDDDTFSHHVNEYKNDFANWIRDVMHNNELADKINGLKSKTEIIDAITGKQQIYSSIKAILSVRKLAKDKGIDLSRITGTGKDGEITKDDVNSASGERPTEAKQVQKINIIKREYDLFGYTDTIPIRGIRRTIAKNMERNSQKTAAVTHFDEADVTMLSSIREKEKIKFEEKGIKLTFIPYIIKALIMAFKDHPYLNAIVDDDKEEISLKKYYNIGIAVDTADGLLVPVLKIAERKNIGDIAKEISELADKAHKRKLDLADMRGGTFTITNVGSIGGIFATPIINYPQVSILLLGRIYEKPVAREGAVEIRKILPLSLSFDHRLVDGAEAARFVNDLKKILEEPKKLNIDAEGSSDNLG